MHKSIIIPLNNYDTFYYPIIMLLVNHPLISCINNPGCLTDYFLLITLHISFHDSSCALHLDIM